MWTSGGRDGGWKLSPDCAQGYPRLIHERLCGDDGLDVFILFAEARVGFFTAFNTFRGVFDGGVVFAVERFGD